MEIKQMKIKVFTLSLFLTQGLFAVGVMDPKVQEFEHENPGCPINSNCSKDMGILLNQWLKVLETGKSDKVKKLNLFRKKYGSPIQLMGRKEIYENADPVMWNSRCKFHNPKNPNNTVYRGFAFLKEKINLENAVFTPVFVYEGTEKKEYRIPYGDSVALIQNDELIVLKDYEDHFYKIAIKPDGNYRFLEIPNPTTRRALAKKIKDYKCPEEKSADKVYFDKYFCQRVLDIDSNQLKTIQVGWSCP